MYPVTPYMVAIGHFIPLYNLYWFYKWPSELMRFVSQNGEPGRIRRSWPGVVLFAAIGMCSVSPELGITVLFALGVYLTRSVRRALVARLEAA